jgi:hypothetical protein
MGLESVCTTLSLGVPKITMIFEEREKCIFRFNFFLQHHNEQRGERWNKRSNGNVCENGFSQRCLSLIKKLFSIISRKFFEVEV